MKQIIIQVVIISIMLLIWHHHSKGIFKPIWWKNEKGNRVAVSLFVSRGHNCAVFSRLSFPEFLDLCLLLEKTGNRIYERGNVKWKFTVAQKRYFLKRVKTMMNLITQAGWRPTKGFPSASVMD